MSHQTPHFPHWLVLWGYSNCCHSYRFHTKLTKLESHSYRVTLKQLATFVGCPQAQVFSSSQSNFTCSKPKAATNNPSDSLIDLNGKNFNICHFYIFDCRIPKLCTVGWRVTAVQGSKRGWDHQHPIRFHSLTLMEKFKLLPFSQFWWQGPQTLYRWSISDCGSRFEKVGGTSHSHSEFSHCL